MKKKLKTKQYTLIELLIVIVVIIAGMALPKFIGVERNAKVSAMDQDLDVLEKAVDLYVSDNDGNYPFVGDKVSVTTQTLKDTLDTIGDDDSQVYTLDMDKLKPYLQNIKYNGEGYEYSTISNTAIDPTGKIDENGVTHHILEGGVSSNTSAQTDPSVKKQINNYTLLKNGKLIDSISNEVVKTNIKDFYYINGEYTNGYLCVTNANEFSFIDLVEDFTEVTGLTGTIDKIYSGGYDTTIINTNGDVFFSSFRCYFGNKLLGLSGTIDKVYSCATATTIINTNGDVFYSSYGSSFTQVSGLSGTIDKVYSYGRNTTITTIDGDVFYSSNGNDFTQVSGLSGTISTIDSDGSITTITNTNEDIYKSSYGNDFTKTN